MSHVGRPAKFSWVKCLSFYEMTNFLRKITYLVKQKDITIGKYVEVFLKFCKGY